MRREVIVLANEERKLNVKGLGKLALAEGGKHKEGRGSESTEMLLNN